MSSARCEILFSAPLRLTDRTEEAASEACAVDSGALRPAIALSVAAGSGVAIIALLLALSMFRTRKVAAR